MRRRLAAVLLLATIGYDAAGAVEPTATPEDYLRALAAAPWPLQMLAYCYREVAEDPAVQQAGRQWNARNGALLANIEKLAEAADIPPDIRLKADEASLAAIEATVARQFDKLAYCTTIARVVDAGNYDIDQRADLKAPLKRIFGKE